MPNTELRTVCTPTADDLSRGEHMHRCQCGTTWKHDDALKYDPSICQADFTTAHECPSCGTAVYDKHWPEGTDEVKNVNNLICLLMMLGPIDSYASDEGNY